MNKIETILLLDANELFEHFRDGIVEICNRLHFNVTVVTDPKVAAELLNKLTNPLLIADRELFFKIEQTVPKSCPTLLIVDIDDTDSRKEARDTGCSEILARHYSNEEIAFVLNGILHYRTDSRRQHPRVLGGFSGNAMVGNHEIAGTVHNISAGGVFLRCYSTLKVGDEIGLTIELPHGSGTLKVNCQCKVVYVKPYHLSEQSLMVPGMGVQFLRIENEEARNLIENYIKDRVIRTN